jgi:hypothetical protein
MPYGPEFFGDPRVPVDRPFLAFKAVAKLRVLSDKPI